MMGVDVKSIVRRRLKAAGQLLFLAKCAGAGCVALTLVVHLIAGLSTPLVILGSGVLVSAVTVHDGGFALGAALCAIGLAVQQVTAPVQVALTSWVSLRVDAYCSQRLIESISATTNLQSVENPKLIESVSDATNALDQREITPGGATAAALMLVVRYTQLMAVVVLLAVIVSVPVGILGLCVALLNRQSQTIGFSAWSTTYLRFAPGRRRMAYLRELATSPTAARDVRILRLTPWIESRYRAEARSYLRPLWWARRLIFRATFLTSAIASMVGASVIIAIAVIALEERGAIQPGAIAIVLQCAMVCLLFGAVFPDIDPKMQYGRAAWEAILRAEAALRTGPKSDSGTLVPDSGGQFQSQPAEIVLSNVVYEYTTADPILKGVNLRLERGRSTAIVGTNGAGKSTLVKVLAGFYAPKSGSVILDGKILDEARRQLWRKRIAIVFQDYLQYQLTLRQNLQMQALFPADDDAEMIDCLREVGLATVLRDLPLGLDTYLSRLIPGGTDLSGGQWQRVALARALYAARHGACALVLDEPTAQLDARGEAEFFTNFLELTKGITTLVISHRFSSVRKADTICVLSKGVISESGSHAELIRARGDYARMFSAQSSRYSAA